MPVGIYPEKKVPVNELTFLYFSCPSRSLLQETEAEEPGRDRESLHFGEDTRQRGQGQEDVRPHTEGCGCARIHLFQDQHTGTCKYNLVV